MAGHRQPGKKNNRAHTSKALPLLQTTTASFPIDAEKIAKLLT